MRAVCDDEDRIGDVGLRTGTIMLIDLVFLTLENKQVFVILCVELINFDWNRDPDNNKNG